MAKTKLKKILKKKLNLKSNSKKRSKQKVFVTRNIPKSGLDLLKKSCIVKVYKKDKIISRKELFKGVKWADALLCLLTDNIDQEVIDKNPNLKVISNLAVGYNNIDVEYATLKNIPVTNTPGVLTDAVAEHTLGLLLSISRRIPESDVFTKSGKYESWAPLLLLGSQLSGKTLGVIGAGRIGYGVAERAYKGLRMRIVYFNPSKNKHFDKELKAKKVSLQKLLTTSDFVTLHVPLLPSTKHLIGKNELRSMKKTAYLINTSRGPVVNEKVLVKALKSKIIAGAALDVFEKEPKLTPGIQKLKNVILTPHIASATIEARGAMSTLAAKNILAILGKNKAKYTVNEKVYFKKHLLKM